LKKNNFKLKSLVAYYNNNQNNNIDNSKQTNKQTTIYKREQKKCRKTTKSTHTLLAPKKENVNFLYKTKPKQIEQIKNDSIYIQFCLFSQFSICVHYTHTFTIILLTFLISF